MVWGKQRGGWRAGGRGSVSARVDPRSFCGQWCLVTARGGGRDRCQRAKPARLRRTLKLGQALGRADAPFPSGVPFAFGGEPVRPHPPTPRREQCRSTSGRAPQCAWLRRALRWPQVPRGASPGRGAGRAGPAGRAPRPRPRAAPPAPPAGAGPSRSYFESDPGLGGRRAAGRGAAGAREP